MKDVTAVQNKPRMPDTLWQVSVPVKLSRRNQTKPEKMLLGVMQDLQSHYPLAGELSYLLPGNKSLGLLAINMRVPGTFSGRSLHLFLSEKQKTTHSFLATILGQMHAGHSLAAMRNLHHQKEMASFVLYGNQTCKNSMPNIS